jgi:hypothetical protein
MPQLQGQPEVWECVGFEAGASWPEESGGGSQIPPHTLVLGQVLRGTDLNGQGQLTHTSQRCSQSPAISFVLFSFHLFVCLFETEFHYAAPANERHCACHLELAQGSWGFNSNPGR